MKAIISVCFFILFFSPAYSQLWRTYADSARIYGAQKNSGKAIEFYDKAKEEFKKDSLGTNSYAQIRDSLAVLYVKKGEYKKAEPLYLEVKQTRELLFGKEDTNYAASCNNLAGLYWYMGQYEKAEPLYLEAMQIREKLLGKQHPDYANTCNGLAVLYDDMGQYEKAESLYLEAKQIKEKLLGKEHPSYANSCNNLAILYREMGQYEKAEPLCLEAKQIREKALGKEHPDYARSCNNLAILYWNMGQYEKAESLYLEAKQIKEKLLGKEHPSYATSCINLALLYWSMGQYEKAEPLYLEAKQIREKVLGKQHPDYAESCNNLAILYAAMGQYEKAEPLYLEAKQIREKVLGKQHPNYAQSCFNLAGLYFKMGQYEKAEPLYLEAKQIREKILGKRHPDYGESCNDLAILYWAMDQPLQAEREFKESFSVNAYNLFSVFQFTNEKEKTAFIKNILGEDDKAYSFYLSSKLKSEQPYSLSLFHRNLILSSSEALQKQLFSANDTSLSNKYNEWINLRKYLSILYSKPFNERKEDVANLEENADQQEEELARFSSGFKKQRQKVEWKDIRDKLQADEASIEFASFHFTNGKRITDSIYYVALVLRKDKPLPSSVFLFDEKQLQNLLTSTGNKTTNDGVMKLYGSRGAGVNSNLAIGKSIYELVWKPLEKELTGIKTIYFAPAGILHRIAFAALPVNKKEVLSDRFRLVQLASTASAVDQQPSFITSSDNLQLYGGIKYDADSTELKQTIRLYENNTKKENTRSIPDDLTRNGSFDYLPGTESEIEVIEKLAAAQQIHVVALSGIKATEESFKALDGKASPSVIHIATHGFFFPDPKVEQKNNFQGSPETNGSVFRRSDNALFRSGLLFTGANIAWQGKPIEGIEDGILTAYEVSNLYLPNTKLAVLSACETALGDIQASEGVYGLQRAFKIAGVQNLIMSLWKVPDAETVEFMQAFYKNLFAGKSISNAFYRAQTALKNKYRSDPYKWAAWVLVR